jgi:MFS family permease
MDMAGATTLLPTVAGHWRASSDLVALIGGALTGLAVMPGCVIGRYPCTRFPPRTVYIAGSLAFGLGEGLMALSPNTPATFAVLSILNAFLAGLANGPYSVVIFASMGSKAAATLGSILSNLGQLPLVPAARRPPSSCAKAFVRAGASGSARSPTCRRCRSSRPR